MAAMKIRSCEGAFGWICARSSVQQIGIRQFAVQDLSQVSVSAEMSAMTAHNKLVKGRKNFSPYNRTQVAVSGIHALVNSDHDDFPTI